MHVWRYNSIASVHYNVLEWLMPNWSNFCFIFSPGTHSLHSINHSLKVLSNMNIFSIQFIDLTLRIHGHDFCKWSQLFHENFIMRQYWDAAINLMLQQIAGANFYDTSTKICLGWRLGGGTWTHGGWVMGV